MAEPVSGLFDQTATIESLKRQLQHGGGGGTSDRMEPRVARLEKNVDTLSSDMTTIRVELGRLDERVKHLPSKGFIVSASLLSITLLSAVIVYADKLRLLVDR